MPFLLTDEQQQIRDEARRMLRDAYSGEHLKTLLETTGAIDEAFWTSARYMGWTAVTVAEKFGGLGLGPIELCLIAQECGRVVAGAPFLGAGFAVAEALRLWGDETVQAEWLPRLAAGEARGVVAIAEGAGDPVPSHPSLRLADGKLAGTKACAVGGALAELAVVYAADEAGAPCLALVDLSLAGVTRSHRETFDNSRGVSDLHFAGVAAVRLNANNADQAAWSLLERQALVSAFEQVGGSETCLELARDYAMQRYAFGQPIGKFQGIKHKVAEIYLATELARGNAESAALALATDAPDFSLKAAAARLNAGAAYDLASGEAIQIHGGVGVTWEYDLHLHYRRARALAVEIGGAAVWEDRIVSGLTLGAAA